MDKKSAIVTAFNYMASSSFDKNALRLNFYKKSRYYAGICDALARHLANPNHGNMLTEVEAGYVTSFVYGVMNAQNRERYDIKFYWRPWYWRSRLRWIKSTRDQISNGDWDYLIN